MMYYDKHIRERNTVICDDWDNACMLMKALWNISHEPGAVGEYAFCVTEEDGIRIDFKFIPYGEDSVVFCAESELWEIVESEVQDAMQDDTQDEIAYSQGEFDDGET